MIIYIVEMDINKLNEAMITLQSEVQYINNKILNEKDIKLQKFMIKQVNQINNVLSKIVEIKTNISTYRD
jgi:flagellar biosynthesis protein FliP